MTGTYAAPRRIAPYRTPARTPPAAHNAQLLTRTSPAENLAVFAQYIPLLGANEDATDMVTTFDAVHDQADPRAVVDGIRHALRPDGVYLAQDIDATSTHHGDVDHPLGPLLYTLSCLHCMTVSLARGGTGLGAMWGRERAERLFRGAGFSDIEVHTLDHDPQNAYHVCRP